MTSWAGWLDRRFEVYAGAAYYDHGLADDLERAGASGVVPTRGLAMGEKLAYYASGARLTKQVHVGGGCQLARRDWRDSDHVAAGDAVSPSGRYKSLCDHLQQRPLGRRDASFELVHILARVAIHLASEAWDHADVVGDAGGWGQPGGARGVWRVAGRTELRRGAAGRPFVSRVVERAESLLQTFAASCADADSLPEDHGAIEAMLG